MPYSVIHVLQSGDVHNSAIASIVERLALNVSAERFRFAVVFLGGHGPLSDRLRAAGIDVTAADWTGSWADPAGALNFASAIRQARADIVQVHSGGRIVRLLAKAAILKSEFWVGLGSYHDSGKGLSIPGSARSADCFSASSRVWRISWFQ